MISDVDIQTRIKCMSPTEIAYQLQLRGAIRKKQLDDMDSCRKALEVEKEILLVVGKLISRDERSRGPIPKIVHENDRKISKQNIQSLEERLRDIDALFQQAEDIFQFIRNFNPTQSGESDGLDGDEKSIKTLIESWSKDILAEIQMVSNRVVSAISTSQKINVAGISLNQSIVDHMINLKKLTNSLEHHDSQSMDKRKTKTYITFAYVWFLLQVFTLPMECNDLLREDIDARECLTAANIPKFGLPKALLALKIR